MGGLALRSAWFGALAALTFAMPAVLSVVIVSGCADKDETRAKQMARAVIFSDVGKMEELSTPRFMEKVRTDGDFMLRAMTGGITGIGIGQFISAQVS